MDVNTAQKAATAHYGDPCLYCRDSMDAIGTGPCPARAGNVSGQRIEYQMSESDFDGLIEAITKARLSPLIAINCGMPESPQEAANRAWCALGDRLGFDGMSVEPSPKGNRFFTAVSR